MKELNLLQAELGRNFVIEKIDLDKESKLRLHTMGIHARNIYVKTGGNSASPVLISNVSNMSTPIALGQNLASTIYISYIHAPH
jgi:Fe2+ transport system protein FeoA